MKERALTRSIRIPAHATLAGLLLAAPALALQAQQADQSPSVFVEQAPRGAVATEQIAVPQAADQSSKVYFPDAITPQSVAAARARAAEQQQLERRAGSDDQVAQLSNGGEGARDIAQLSDGDSVRALAQLSPAEQQVLIDAVEGTDICEQASNIPAIRELCESRIETRSAEFARDNSGGSAEDNLLGGGFDSARLATLQAVITRLAQNTASADDFSDQAIASVALGQQAALSDAQATAVEGDPTSGLSQETQAVVNAIVQQLGGN